MDEIPKMDAKPKEKKKTKLVKIQKMDQKSYYKSTFCHSVVDLDSDCVNYFEARSQRICGSTFTN